MKFTILCWQNAFAWLCFYAFLYEVALYPILYPLLHKYGIDILALQDKGMLWDLVFGMLGIGGLKTYEKTKNL